MAPKAGKAKPKAKGDKKKKEEKGTTVLQTHACSYSADETSAEFQVEKR